MKHDINLMFTILLFISFYGGQLVILRYAPVNEEPLWLIVWSCVFGVVILASFWLLPPRGRRNPDE